MVWAGMRSEEQRGRNVKETIREWVIEIETKMNGERIYEY